MSRSKGRKAVATRSPGQPRDMSGDLARHRQHHDGRVTRPPGGFAETVGNAGDVPAVRQRSSDQMGGTPTTAYESQGMPYSGSTAWHPSSADY